MIQYIIETIAFQLLFLLVYDLILKKETFFNWNRAYLILTPLLSLLLPLIELSSVQQAIPVGYTYTFPEIVVFSETEASTRAFQPSWMWLLYCGIFFSFALLGFKLYKLAKLIRKGTVTSFQDFKQVILQESHAAFSFFDYIFLGEEIIKREHKHIIDHELVHIKQKHTWDLIYFELLRIVFWFNPLIYVYQGRVSELHEFIADSQVSKGNENAHYEQLLQEVFQTENLSFVNQFFKASLIKKRIIMLTKQRSKEIFKLKYLLVVPLLLGILMYNSCEKVAPEVQNEISGKTIESHQEVGVPFAIIEEAPIFPGCEDAADKRECFQEKMRNHIKKHFNYPQDAQERGVEGRVYVNFVISSEGTISNVRMRGPDSVLEEEVARIISRLPDFTPGKQKGQAANVPYSIPIIFKLATLSNADFVGKNNSEDVVAVPFTVIDEVPIFPGCENATDQRDCFQEKMKAHIRKNFRYPIEAQERGVDGRVYVNFIILEDGTISNVRMRGPDKVLEQEAARIISRLPNFTPGKQKGHAVNVPFSIPISFKLN